MHSPQDQPNGSQLRSLISAAKNTSVLYELKRKLFSLQMSNDSLTSTQCLVFSHHATDPTNNPFVISLFVVLYLHIFVLGLIGNVAVMYLTFKHRHLQTVQNIFILNLALSDVIVCLLSLPFTPVTNVYKEWYFGSPFCHLLPMVQGVSVFVSTFSLSAIALDRFNLVVRPHCHPLNARGACLVAVILWIVSVVVCLPYGWYMQVETIDGYCGQYCSERWPSPDVRRGYALVVLTTQFLLPFATMAVCYYTIFSVLRERAAVKLKKLSERSQLLETSNILRKDSFEPHSTSPLIPEEKRRITLVGQQRRTTTILASMVLIFGVTWLPHNAYTIIMDYDEQIFHWSETDITYLLSMTTHCIAMLTNVANPFLYAWLNPSFKEMLLKTLGGKSRGSIKYNASLSEVSARKHTIIKITGSSEPKDDF